MSFKNENRQTWDIESKTVIRVLALFVATLLVIVFIKSIVGPLVLIFVSFFLALALNPAVSKITNLLKSKSRVQATTITYVLFLTFLIAFVSFVVPPLFRQTADFIQDVPDTIKEFNREGSAANNFIEKYKLEEQINNFSNDFSRHFSTVGQPILQTAGVIGTTVINVLTVLVLTFMMLVEGPAWLARFWSIQSSKNRKHHRMLAGKMYRVVTNYVNGQVFIAALGGLFATVAIFILSQVFDASVNAVALGGIIAMFALLPLIGTILGSVVVVLACLLVSAPLAIAVAVYFIIYQQIENVTIQPFVQARSNSLTPLIVFTAALLGIGLGGILGAFVAIPAAGCIKILVEDHFERRRTATVTEV